MKSTFRLLLLAATILVGVSNAESKDIPLNVNEFKQLYNQLLAGKTLSTELEQDGTNITKERKYGVPLDVGAGDFEVPVTTVITKTKDGSLEQRITIEILDRVSNLGDAALISEELRKTTVESPGQEPLSTNDVEYGGLYRVAKNDKGGFYISNFGLTPSGLVEGEDMILAGTMASNSCYLENGITKCELTIREYRLGEYKQLRGYTQIEAVGDDGVEISVESKK